MEPIVITQVIIGEEHRFMVPGPILMAQTVLTKKPTGLSFIPVKRVILPGQPIKQENPEVPPDMGAGPAAAGAPEVLVSKIWLLVVGC